MRKKKRFFKIKIKIKIKIGVNIFFSRLRYFSPQNAASDDDGFSGSFCIHSDQFYKTFFAV